MSQIAFAVLNLVASGAAATAAWLAYDAMKEQQKWVEDQATAAERRRDTRARTRMQAHLGIAIGALARVIYTYEDPRRGFVFLEDPARDALRHVRDALEPAVELYPAQARQLVLVENDLEALVDFIQDVDARNREPAWLVPIWPQAREIAHGAIREMYRTVRDTLGDAYVPALLPASDADPAPEGWPEFHDELLRSMAKFAEGREEKIARTRYEQEPPTGG